MRVHVPVLLALSCNSPFWRADVTGLHSTRTPIFRAFPRVGVPPAYGTWQGYADQIDFMVRSGVMEDYTYLWYDVRPHPRLGTVEIRVCDSQTRIEHTLGLAALIQAMVKELCEHFDAGVELSDYPWQMLDENKWLAARHGLDASLVDLPGSDRVSARDLAQRLLDRLRPHAEELGSAAELAGHRGPPAQRHRLRAPAQGLRGQPRPARGHEGDRRGDRRGPGAGLRARRRARVTARGAAPGEVASVAFMPPAPDLFVVCKSCGSEVSSYVTECPYCGTRLRKRAPKLDAPELTERAAQAPAAAAAEAARPGRSPG